MYQWLLSGRSLLLRQNVPVSILRNSNHFPRQKQATGLKILPPVLARSIARTIDSMEFCTSITVFVAFTCAR